MTAMRRVAGWLSGLALLILMPALAQAPRTRGTPNPALTLRVGLWTLWHDKEVTISSMPDGGASIRTCIRPSEVCTASPLTHPVKIRASGDRLDLGKIGAGEALVIGPVALAAHGESLILRNPLHITARSGVLVFSLTLPIESYVERVVASESGSADSLESMKALAIVVRSFALHQTHGHADYDLCDSTHCQFLHWASNAGRQARSHAATLATSGQTLWFHGRRAEAWFHQNCGGRTASPAEVWGGKEAVHKQLPWLASHTDSYCTAKGAREWSASLSRSELTTALAAQGLARPGWKNLTVLRRGESGRTVMLLLDTVEISAEDFRLAVGRAMGWNRIPSTWFEVAHQGDQFVFHGRGSGHGVGLCQAGATVMAAGGRGYDEILAQYFPGATAADEATGEAWKNWQGHGFTLESLDKADAAYLPELSQALAEAQGRSTVRPAHSITVRAFRSTQAFRGATLAPGWVAAFTEGDWIGTQPLRTLAARKMLVPVLRHEFLHVLVEDEAAPSVPLWLREGLAELWAGDTPKPASPRPTLKMDEIDRALVYSTSEAQSEAAHRAAGWYAARLVERFGQAQVTAWLRSGVPSAALAALR